tara:strand:+ start:39535 stop:39849 length:315 start_codon:yes stop_codon:yes gene_type:complete
MLAIKKIPINPYIIVRILYSLFILSVFENKKIAGIKTAKSKLAAIKISPILVPKIYIPTKGRLNNSKILTNVSVRKGIILYKLFNIKLSEYHYKYYLLFNLHIL